MKTTYRITLLVISLLLVISITRGTSYSLWKKVEVQKEQNIVESSCFSIEFSESSNINLKNAMPISDASGLKKTPYTFTIKNTCNADSKTKISLNVLNSSTMDSSIIKFSMKYGSLANSTPVLLDTFNKGESSTNVKENYLVKEDIIRGNEEKTYSIYLWMDESAGNEYMNKIFNAKINITSEAIEDTPKYMAETITDLASKDTVNFADDDADNNIRYIGKDPGNYVYFNCSDYSNQTADTCEKWRIIGVFNNITKEDGTKENLVKIIRNESIGSFLFDYKQDGIGTSTSSYGSNDWTDSQLMMMLNPSDYLKNGYSIDGNIVRDSNGIKIFQNMGSYYEGSVGCKPSSAGIQSTNRPGGGSGSSSGGSSSGGSGAKSTSSVAETYTCSEIDFTSTGLKNDLTRDSIESVVWNINGVSYSLASEQADYWYNAERKENIYTDRATTWTGKIGLIYPSDYGYATSGGTKYNRSFCLTASLNNMDWDSYNDCPSNDYLSESTGSKWTLNHYLSISTSTYIIDSAGPIAYVDPNYCADSYVAENSRAKAYPTLYLKSNISITSGDGSSTSPYQLNLN